MKGIADRLTGTDGKIAGIEIKQTSMEDGLRALEKLRGTSSDGGSTTAGFSGGPGGPYGKNYHFSSGGGIHIPSCIEMKGWSVLDW